MYIATIKSPRIAVQNQRYLPVIPNNKRTVSVDWSLVKDLRQARNVFIGSNEGRLRDDGRPMDITHILSSIDTIVELASSRHFSLTDADLCGRVRIAIDIVKDAKLVNDHVLLRVQTTMARLAYDLKKFFADKDRGDINAALKISEDVRKLQVVTRAQTRIGSHRRHPSTNFPYHYPRPSFAAS